MEINLGNEHLQGGHILVELNKLQNIRKHIPFSQKFSLDKIYRVGERDFWK